jgi:PAT family beta-lactamase induction signal transducer AmpG
VARFGLKRSLIWLCLMLNVPHLTFLYLAVFLPTDVAWITIIVVIEKLGFGIGSVALMLYMMQQVAPGNYKTAHYAISTGLMALCMMVTGMVSGVLEEAVGYEWFFLIVMFATVPSLVVSWLAPFNIDTSDDAGAKEAAAH